MITCGVQHCLVLLSPFRTYYSIFFTFSKNISPKSDSFTPLSVLVWVTRPFYILQIFCQDLPQGEAYLSLFNFLFLLFQKSRGYASDVVLGTQQQGPQVPHELPGVLPIQEACQVDLHHLTIWVLQHTHEGGKEAIWALKWWKAPIRGK